MPTSSRTQPLTTVSWLSLMITAVAVAGYLALSAPGRDLPMLAVVSLLLGTPHGAVDPVLLQFDRQAPRGRALLRLLPLYVVTFATVLVLALAVPVLGVALVVVCSVVHLGSTDDALRRERDGRPPRHSLLATIAYGGPIGFLAFARWPKHVRQIFAPFSPQVASALRIPMLAAAGVTLAAVFAFAVLALWRHAWLEAAEVLVLAALFLLLPPLAAFGIYFGGWHALRQYTRLYLETREEPSESATPSSVPIKNLTRPQFFLATAVFTAATFTVSAVAVAVLRSTPGALADKVHRLGLGSWLIVLLGAAIVPHAITILRHERWRARTWDRRGPSESIRTLPVRSISS